MAAPLRVPTEGLAPGERELDAEASRYASRVHRLRAGDRLILFDPTARTEASATIVSIARNKVRVAVAEPSIASLLPSRSVALLQAVAKGDKMDAIVRDATELAVTRFDPITTARSIAERANAKVVARWKRVALEAARQCGRGDVPLIAEPRALALAASAAREDVRIALSPTAERALVDVAREAVLSRPACSIAIAVGPEGGFEPSELDALTIAGFTVARIGRFTLRTETAAAASLAVLLDLVGS